MFPTSESKKKNLIKCGVFFAGRLLGPDSPEQILSKPFSRTKLKKSEEEKKRNEKAQKKRYEQLICISKCETGRKGERGEGERDKNEKEKERKTRSA